jgi:hypothetical protein
MQAALVRERLLVLAVLAGPGQLGKVILVVLKLIMVVEEEVAQGLLVLLAHLPMADQEGQVLLHLYLGVQFNMQVAAAVDAKQVLLP